MATKTDGLVFIITSSDRKVNELYVPHDFSTDFLGIGFKYSNLDFFYFLLLFYGLVRPKAIFHLPRMDVGCAVPDNVIGTNAFFSFTELKVRQQSTVQMAAMKFHSWPPGNTANGSHIFSQYRNFIKNGQHRLTKVITFENTNILGK